MQSKDALKLMRSGQPVNIEFITCDVSRNTGGDIKYMNNAVVSASSHDKKKNGTITMREFPDGDPVSIHVCLLQKINNEFIN